MIVVAANQLKIRVFIGNTTNTTFYTGKYIQIGILGAHVIRLTRLERLFGGAHTHARSIVAFGRGGEEFMDISTTVVEKLIAMAFTEIYDCTLGWFPEREVVASAACSAVDKTTVDQARENLGIEVVKINGIPHWRWSAPTDPGEMWDLKDEELRKGEQLR